MLFISYFFKTRFELIYFYNSGVFKYNLINVSEGGGERGGAHSALEHTEVILKFQTWKCQLCFRVSVLDLGLWLLILHFGKFLSYKCSDLFSSRSEFCQK